ncbi:hypothetical protein B0T18DRAFT_335199 [Schizothecium vesticola]|uniref:Uncharacterized protein n=1 Tax=Schizothecium vesticola TaxID=314040 RepID=A0AA40EIG5_9PEZI|nr:hypothetical protein B0T18DRAFT_335199 [Schizothecium vesticola]
MFVGGAERNIRFAASIVDACADATTYALRCTSGPAMISPGICGANAEQITVTTNPTFFRVSSAAVTRTMGNDLSATVQGTCRLAETTEAVCAWTVGASVDKTSTITSSTTTYLGTNVYRHDVAITAGAEKTVSPTACAAPIQGSGAAEGMKRVGVWGLVGAMGLVVVMGM